MYDVILTLLLLLLLVAIRFTYFGLIAKFDGKKTVRFEQHPTNSNLRILCVGDSIGVGVGSSAPVNSLLGNIGRDFPSADITNYSINGVKTAELFNHTEEQDLKNYDLVIVMVGGMDVIKMTDLGELEVILQQFVSFLKRHTKKIVLIPPNNTGYLPLYHFPFREILNYRAQKVQKIFKEVGDTNSCNVIDESIDELLIDKNKYFSRDKSHPNDLGYAVWYSKMKKSFTNSI